MYFGNIVTSSNLEEENFKICRDLDSINKELPTLIVGWSKSKELFGNDISILHKKIERNLYWTFDGKERKSEFEEDIDSFKELCINNYGENIPYVYVDIIHSKLKIIKRILEKINNLKEKITYVSDNNMLYIYGENIIFGIDLNVLEYTSIKKEKVLTKLLSSPNTIFVDDEIFNKCKDIFYKVKHKTKLIPYIYKNGDYE